MTPAPTIRIHLNLARYRWGRLWYILRSLDKPNRGCVTLSHKRLLELLGRRQSTLYSQIAAARRCGAIRSASRLGDTWTIYLGGLKAVCKRLRLLDWGATIEISDDELLNFYRPTISAAAAHCLQEKSRYQATMSLNKTEREQHRIPEAYDILTAQSKINLPSLATPPARGKEVDYVLAVDDKRIWVSEGFVPFGASQRGIGQLISLSDRTIRRHLKTLSIPSKQVVQARSRYRVAYEEARCLGDERIEIDDRRPQEVKARPYEIEFRRLFKGFGKVWLRRTNLYALDFARCTQQATRRELYHFWGIDLNFNAPKFIAYKRQCFKNGHPSKEQIAKIYKRWKDREIGAAIDKWNLSKSAAPSAIGVAYKSRQGTSLFSDSREFNSDSSQVLTRQATPRNRADQPGHF